MKFKPSPTDNERTFRESATQTHYYLLPYAFRCIVRDTVTGEEVTSKEAKVIRPELTVTGGQVGHESEIRLSISGGVGPYYIECKRGTKGHADAYYELPKLKILNGGGRYFWDVSIKGISKHKSKDMDIFGYQVWYNHYTYEFTVYDMYGNKATVSILMHSDNEEITNSI